MKLMFWVLKRIKMTTFSKVIKIKQIRFLASFLQEGGGGRLRNNHKNKNDNKAFKYSNLKKVSEQSNIIQNKYYFEKN
jgi:hypothetical protein